MCLGVLPASVSAPGEARDEVEAPGTGFADDCWLPNRCWELNQVLPEKQSMLLTTVDQFLRRRKQRPRNFTQFRTYWQS